LQFLLAVLFAVQGIVKLGGSPAWVSRFQRWGYPDHFYLIVGALELLAAIALVIPRVAKWGALVLIVVMAGATATHAVYREPQVTTTLILLASLAIIVYLRRLDGFKHQLRAQPCDGVLIGGGVAGDPAMSYFMEQIVDVTHEVAPKRKLCFTTTQSMYAKL
jgi:putative oxidoreductase